MSTYHIEGIRPQDWEPIRQWRNAQMDILRQDHEITPEEQCAYARKYYDECLSYKPPQKLYSFFVSGPSEIRPGLPTHKEAVEDMEPKLIGYGGLVHINWDTLSAEVSFLMDPERKKYILKYAMEWLTFLVMLRDVTAKMGLMKWRSETYFDTEDHTRGVHVRVIRALFDTDEPIASRSIIQEWSI